MNDNILSFDREHDPKEDYPYDDYDYGYGSHAHGSSLTSLGDLLELVVIDDTVVLSHQRPVEGSGYEGLARELGRGRPAVPPTPPQPPMPPHHEEVLTWLALLVGGQGQLESLASTPLPRSEELDLERLASRHQERVASIDAELTRVADLVFGPEVLTAARRLLVRTLLAQPSFLKGPAADEVLACATLTAVAKANDLVGQGRVVPVSLIRTLFNLRSAPNERVQAMARAVAPHNGLLTGWRRPVLDVTVLGSPDFLVGTFREAVITARDAALELRAATPEA